MDDIGTMVLPFMVLLDTVISHPITLPVILCHLQSTYSFEEENAIEKCECNKYFLFSFCLQESKGYDFESETDTETIAKLVKYMYDNRESQDISFTTLVERVIQQLVLNCSFKASCSSNNQHKL